MHLRPDQARQLEVAVDNLLARERIKTPFGLKGDSAPDYYVNGNPGPNDAVTRQMERAVSNFAVVDPLTGQSTRLTEALADRPTLRALHMVTADSLRTPTFTEFNNPDFEGVTAPLDCVPSTDLTTTVKQCQAVETWHHGDIQPQITTTWLGLVGPGVRRLGVNNQIWSDHTDTRPTTLALVGLRDDYRHDGRVLLDVLDPEAVVVNGHRDALLQLGQVYKQLDATVGSFGTSVVTADTRAVATGNPGNDRTYLTFEDQLNNLTNDRNAVALQISQFLEAATFNRTRVDDATVSSLIQQAQNIINRAQQLASGS